MIKDYLKKTRLNNLRFWVKLHPAVPKETLKKRLGNNWADQLFIVKGPANNYIPKSDLIISGMSSLCLETMSLGIPVIFIDNLSGLSYNPIPDEIPQVLWRSCRTSNDIKNAIEYYRKRSNVEIKEHKEIGIKIKNHYIDPVNKKSVNIFLMFN